MHSISTKPEVILSVIASPDKSGLANYFYVDLNNKNLTDIFRNIAHPPTILIQVEALRFASKCIFGDKEMKVIGAAVIAVPLSRIIVTSLCLSL